MQIPYSLSISSLSDLYQLLRETFVSLATKCLVCTPAGGRHYTGSVSGFIGFFSKANIEHWIFSNIQFFILLAKSFGRNPVVAHLLSRSSLLLLFRLYFFERFLWKMKVQINKLLLANGWNDGLRFKNAHYFATTHCLFYTIGLKTKVHNEHVKIIVLPSFTLSLTTSCLSCASLLPLPLLSSKAQHYRCGPADGKQLGEGAPCKKREKEQDNEQAAAGEWGQCFMDKLDSVPKWS